MTALGLCAAIPLPDKLPDAYLQFIRHAHTGLPIPAGWTESGMCATFDQGISDPADGIARGYITVDNVKTCSTANATSGATYFGVDGVTKNDTSANVLWGDYFLVDPTGNFAQGDTLVHIEADGDGRLRVGQVHLLRPLLDSRIQRRRLRIQRRGLSRGSAYDVGLSLLRGRRRTFH